MNRIEKNNRAFFKLVLILAVLAAIIAAGSPLACAASNFYIRSMNVDVKVNEDDTYDIIETLDVTFTQPSHGIYRKIPYEAELDRDGQTSRFRAGIRDFKMISGQKYKDTSDDYYFNMRFGDENKYEKTEATYKYKYTYDMKGDHLKGADEFYYNLAGTEWEAQSINKIEYKVSFPKKIAPSKVGVKANDVNQKFSVDDSCKVISGMTNTNVKYGLTMRVVLPEDYYNREAGTNNVPYYLLLAALFVLTIGGMLMWSRYGRDKKMVRTVEIGPPDELPSEIIGYLYDGSSENHHAVSILLELANDGYIKIIETKKKSFKLVCMKEYDGNDKCAQLFMEGLFKNYSRNEVTKGQLKDKFYKTVDDIKVEIEKQYGKRLYDEKAGKISGILKMIGFAAFALLYISTRLMNGYSLFGDQKITMITLLIMAVACTGGGFLLLFSFVNKRKVSRIFGGIAIVLVGMGTAYFCGTFPLEENPVFAAGFVMSAVLFMLSNICERKTDWYVDMLGKVSGYRNFLKKTEKDRIEKLAEQDPEYFYRNLAYAYALDVTDAYAKQFRGIVSEPPAWYESSTRFGNGNAFDAYTMSSMMHDMMGGLSSAMTSSPSSSSGGGSFSSGGGAGGGGGGSL